MNHSKILDLFNKKKTKDNFYKVIQPRSLHVQHESPIIEKTPSAIIPPPAPITKVPVKELGNQYVYNNKIYDKPESKPQINSKYIYQNKVYEVPTWASSNNAYHTAPTLADRALRGDRISDAEGLKRSTEAPDGIYIYGDTLYASGTRGNLLGHEWQQNFEHIAKPIAKGLITNNIDKITDFGQMVAPQYAPEISLVGDALSYGRTLMNSKSNDETKVNIQALDRYKNAVKAMDANPQIKKAVGFSVGGITVEELKNKYKDLTGNVYGTPYVDPFGKEIIKDQLNTERTIRNARYGNSLLNQPAKYVDNKMQDLAEKSLGLDQVKTMNDTGINRFRQAGDLLTALDNSAITSVKAENLFNPLKAHSYQDQASQNFTADASNAFGRVNADNSISLIQ